MFCRLHQNFFDDPETLARHEGLIEDLLLAHVTGNFILVLNPEEVQLVATLPNLGGRARAALDRILLKSNDYNVACALAGRIVIVCPPEIEANFQILGREVNVSTRLMSHDRLMGQAFFLTENVVDAKLLSKLSDLFFLYEGYPDYLVKARIVSGGGSTIADVLENEVPVPQRGVMVCDRDVCETVPPFRAATTGYHAFERAEGINLCRGQIGISQCTPFFAFLASWGYSLENFIGPNIADLYFEKNNRRDERHGFQRAFPDFPSLDEAEALVWRYLDLKNGTTNMGPVLNTLRARLGAVPASLTPRLRHFVELRLPRDVLNWTIQNATATRNSRALARAFGNDLQIAEYQRGLGELSNILKTMLAGDRDASRF